MPRLHVPIRLRWSDLDAYGHVNNAAILTLLEEARIAVFWNLEGLDPDAPLPTAVIDASAGATTYTLIARQGVEYLVPIPYLRQPLDVQTWIGGLGGASIEVCYEVCSPQDAEPFTVYARASSAIVLVDAATTKARRMTDDERAAWSPYLDEPVVFTKG
jgi:acyl-CoA thioester hydrolase